MFKLCNEPCLSLIQTSSNAKKNLCKRFYNCYERKRCVSARKKCLKFNYSKKNPFKVLTDSRWFRVILSYTVKFYIYMNAILSLALSVVFILTLIQIWLKNDILRAYSTKSWQTIFISCVSPLPPLYRLVLRPNFIHSTLSHQNQESKKVKGQSDNVRSCCLLRMKSSCWSSFIHFQLNHLK